MRTILNMIGEVVILVICVVSVFIGLYYKRSTSYWRIRKVPFVEPIFPFGNLLNSLTSNLYLGIHLKDIYLECRTKSWKHLGIYSMAWPRYFPVDQGIIQHILVQDFEHFIDRGFYYNEKYDPLSANLFSLGGERWRTLRAKLSPAFTSGKLRVIFDSLIRCGYQLQEAVERLSKHDDVIEIKELSVCYSINVIALCAFGLDCNCFISPNSDFEKMGKKAFEYTSWLRRGKMIFAFSNPNLAEWLGIEVFGKEYTDFYVNIVKKTIAFREKHNVVGKDLMQLIIELRSIWGSKTTIEELAAQVFIFFSAGFETSSITLSFCLYELGLNLNIQRKVREEIRSILLKYEGNFMYEAILEMKYTNKVIEETLRKYPPVAYIGRKCVKDYTVPGTDLVLSRGMHVDISILGIHYDPEYYPEPENFDPERFNEENKGLRKTCTYLPFGEGPRTCIGMRFAMMQLKLALAILLNEYEFSLDSETATPLEFVKYSFTLQPRSGIYMRLKKL